MSWPEFLRRATRNLFFTGKGGVGKTSLACASAIALVDAGKRVLLVSTDPASNLEEVLGVPLRDQPTPIPQVTGLSAFDLDPTRTAREYRDRIVGPYRQMLPEALVATLEEQLSGACTVEIAAFDEFSRLMADPSTNAAFDHIVFDTAPTGHTLRLLSLPAAWSDFIRTNSTGTSCLGPLAGLQERHALYGNTVAALSDAELTTLVLVTRPENSALTETERSSAELAALGVRNQHLVVNAVFHAADPHDPLAQAMERRGRQAMASQPEALLGLPRTELPLAPCNLVGIPSLRAVFQGHVARMQRRRTSRNRSQVLAAPVARLVDEMARTGHGAVFMMGKGGVGKTTIAAAVAVELAARGHKVHLTTTDPAAHLQGTLQDVPPGLMLSRIDPQVETDAYREEIMATVGAGLDATGRALLEEDLRSPCTEEIAVFRAFGRTVDQAQDAFVVLDTAPTGHTILLLDAAQAYHRELSRQASEIPHSVRELLPRLRDSEFTRILIVTLPEATPVHEAAKLQEDLLRADIHVFGWVVNQSLSPLCLTDPVLQARQDAEEVYITEVTHRLAYRAAIIPWQADPPVGIDRLLALVRDPTDTLHVL